MPKARKKTAGKTLTSKQMKKTKGGVNLNASALQVAQPRSLSSSAS